MKLTKAKPTIEWRDRLIEVKQFRADALLDHPFNPKVHPDSQKGPLLALLSEVGKVDILRAYYSKRNKNRLTLWDGHCRRELKADEVWNVGIYDLTDAEADLLLQTFDPIGWMAQQQNERAKTLIDSLRIKNSQLVSFVANQREKLLSLQLEQAAAVKKKEADDKDDGAAGDHKTFSLPLSVTQEKTIRDAIKKAKTIYSTSHSGEALAKLCKSFLDGDN